MSACGCVQVKAQRERCICCDQDSPVGFAVSDEMWLAVAGQMGGVYCIMCFAARADALDIDWMDCIQFWPVSAVYANQAGDPQLDCWQVAPGTPDSDGIVWERYELGCSGKNKDRRQCQRYIVGLMGYNGGFEHKVLGHCDLRNKEWLCWQHGVERDREDAAKKKDKT